MLETRRSVSSPPRSRRKFGSSFIVDISVRLAPAAGDGAMGGSAPRSRCCVRVCPAPEAVPVGRRALLRAEVAPERARVLTCADLPVAGWAESESGTTRVAPQQDQPYPSAPPAASSELQPKTRPQRSQLQLTCQHWPHR